MADSAPEPRREHELGGGRPDRPCMPERFEALYEEQFAFVWRTVRRLGVDEHAVEDLVQETFLTAFRRLASFEGRSQVRTWLFGIALGLVRNHRRMRRRKEAPLRAVEDEQDFPVGPASEPEPLARAVESEAVRLLHELLGEMSEPRRSLFVAVEIEQLPVTDVAEALGENENTIHSRLRAARRDFEAALKRLRAREQGLAQRRVP